MTYTPRPATADLLNHALAHIESVPYKVSVRWVFYRLLQDGYYSEKEDYKRCVSLTSKARKRFWNGWHPDLLADESRSPILENYGFCSEEEWIDAIRDGIGCSLDKSLGQETRVIIAYEARAMTGQFREYTDGIDLFPFAGDASIPYKWSLAKTIERSDLPVVLIYFGDYDFKGAQIATAALKDLRKWSDEPFEFIHGGLDSDQVGRYDMPENPEKPGEYQWEALKDNQASEIIEAALDGLWSREKYVAVLERELKAEAELKEYLEGFDNEYQRKDE